MAQIIIYPMDLSKPRIMQALAAYNQYSIPKDMKGKLYYYLNPKLYLPLYKGLDISVAWAIIYRGALNFIPPLIY